MSDSVEKKVKERLDKLAEETGFPIEEILEIYNEKLSILKEKYQKKEVRPLACRQTVIAVKWTIKQLKDVPPRYIYIVGDSGVRDRVEDIRRKAYRLWEQEPEKAVAQGLMTPDGMVIDTRKKVWGKDNPNYGMPLPDNIHAYERHLVGIVSDTPDFEECQIGVIRAYDKRVEELKTVKLWRTYSFRAREKTTEDSTERVFNYNVGTRFIEIPNPYEPEELLNKIEIYEVNNVPSLFKAYQKKKKRPIVPVNVIVWRVSEGKNNVFVEPDSTDTVIMFPNFIPVNFTEGMEVVFFGRIGKWREKYRINAMGYVIYKELPEEIGL